MVISKVVIVSAKRTPIGNLCGGLSTLHAHELGSRVLRAILSDISLKGSEISEVIMGQVLTAGCGQNPARQTSVISGLPYEVPAYTINKVCGSGLMSVYLGAQSIVVGQNNIVIAGGQENMSLSPHVISLRQFCKMGNKELIDTMLYDGLTDAFHLYHMGVTAENIALKFNITRYEQDKYSYFSQKKAKDAQLNNRFCDEIVTISTKDKKKTIIIKDDEFPKHETSIETLSKLKVVFRSNGTVTAGNSSGICDGAAAVLMMSEEEAFKRNLKVLVEIVSVASSGIEPEYMGIAPVLAIKKALLKAQWNVEDLDLIESNEAFASQSIAVNRLMGWDINKVNVNGGAIALGHPIGASGARCLVTLIHEMIKRNVEKGLVSLCVGGGMGIAMCIKRKRD